MGFDPEDKLSSKNPKQVSNPSSLTGGDSGEAMDRSSRGSSERLRHKDRSVTLWDYNRMALQAFPRVYKVAALLGAIAAMVLLAWMVTDIKGPRGRSGQDAALAIETSTATPLPPSPTANPGAAIRTEAPTATAAPTSTSSPTPQPIEINFNADNYTITQGECTTLRWEVLGAEGARLLGTEVELVEAQEVCPPLSTTYTLIADNEAVSLESSFVVEVLVPTATDALGCTGYDQNGQLVCKESCTDNDPRETCALP